MNKPLSLLTSMRPNAGPALPLAMAARTVQSLLGIFAAWTLAGILDAVVFHQASLTDSASALLLLAGGYGARALCAFAADQAAVRASTAIRRVLFHRLLDRLVQLGPMRLSGTATGAVVSTLVEALAGTDPFWRRWLPALAAASCLPPAVILVALTQNWPIALVFVLTLPLLPLFMFLIGKSAEDASQKQWATLLRLGGSLLDAVKGLPDLKILRASKREIETVVRMAETYRSSAMAVLRIAFLSALTLEFFATVSIAMVAVLVGFKLLWGEMDFRSGFFLLLLAPEFYAPLRLLGAQRHAKIEAVAAAEKIAALLDLPLPAAHAGSLRPALGPALRIRFQDVRVSYDGKRNALDGVRLDVAPGEHVAVVGPSGAGKSSLVAALLGFVDPCAGRILIDDHPLDEIDRACWRAQLAYVPQRPHFFEGTVGDNIAMGRPPCTGKTTRQCVEDALDAARASAIVAKLDKGLETCLGEKGAGLSGGEAQRLALARAFYASLSAPLIVFDEPTAHLDPKTERSLEEAIAAFARGRTMLTVAHRLSTIRHADRIVVLDQGRIVEEGSHSALLALGGLYAAMVAPVSPAGPRP